MSQLLRTSMLRSLVLGAAIGFGAPAATAHPHVNIDIAVEVVVDNGTIKGIRHLWTFDDFYSASAVDGLDTNKDGIYTREELAELAKTNIEGLKEFNYFTFPTLAGAEQKVADPKVQDGWHEFKDGKLTLHFFVPFASPVLLDAKDFEVSVYDPTFFIAFNLKDDKLVTLSASAPKSCAVTVGKAKQDGSDTSRLNESFFSALGSGNYGFSFAKPISVVCAKS